MFFFLILGFVNEKPFNGIFCDFLIDSGLGFLLPYAHPITWGGIFRNKHLMPVLYPLSAFLPKLFMIESASVLFCISVGWVAINYGVSWEFYILIITTTK